MEQSITFKQQQRNGRAKLLAILAVFLVPVIAAQFILSQNLYQGGVTNQGTLIEPYTSYETVFSGQLPESALIAEQQTWHLTYLIPQNCQQDCQQQIELLEATYLLLGKDKPRVTAVLLANENSSLIGPQISELATATIPNFAGQTQGSVVVVDKLGQWVMAFDPQQFESAQAMHAAILGDMKKLLKLSRVG